MVALSFSCSSFSVGGTGSPLPGSATPTVGHWGGLGLGLGLRIGLGLGLGLGLGVRVRVRWTVGVADPGSGGPEPCRFGEVGAYDVIRSTPSRLP